MWLFIIVLVILILFCFELNIKWTKQEIADYYGVSKKTLGKWVQFCCPRIDYVKWKKVRKLNILDALITFVALGFIEDNEVLTKGEILQKCETYYHTVRENIALNLNKLVSRVVLR